MIAKTSIRANAIAVVDDIILSVCGSILVSLCFEIATDSEFRHAAGKFFYELPGDIARGISYWAENWVAGEKCIIQFSADQWSRITGCANNFAKTFYNVDGATVTTGENGHIGFTEQSQFTIHLNELNPDTQSRSIQNVFLNDMTITFYDPSSLENTMKMFPVYPDDDFFRGRSGYLMSSYIVNVSPLNLRFFCSPSFVPSNMINNFKFYGDYVSESLPNITPSMRFFYNDNRSVFETFHLGNVKNVYERFTRIFTIDNKPCYLLRCSDGKFRFVTYESAFGNESDYVYLSITNSKTGEKFDSFSDMINFYSIVCDASSLDFPATNGRESVDDGVYAGNMSGVHVPSLPDVYDGTDDVSLNIPTTKTATGDYVADIDAIRIANPSDILTYEKPIAFPDGVPKIDSSGLFDKFPFCIPTDIYNLFVGFSAESAPPVFKIPFKYFKRDGEYLIDYEITIDFSQLSEIAYLSRWFISIEFVFGLILITRRVIGA